MKTSLPFRLLLLFVFVFSMTSCGDFMRKRSFDEAQNYFFSTPLEQHTPAQGAKASRWILKDQELGIEFLKPYLGSSEPSEKAVAIMLIQAMAAERFHKDLVTALDSEDWSEAPGHLGDYIILMEPAIRAGEKGIVEK